MFHLQAPIWPTRWRHWAGVILAVTTLAMPVRAHGPVQVTTWTAQVLNPHWQLLRSTPCGSVLSAGSDGAIWTLPGTSGAHWAASQTQHSGRVVDMIEFQSTLLAVGTRGLLLRSDDCGQRWVTLDVAGRDDLMAAASHGSDVLVAAGAYLLRARGTTATWQRLPSPVPGLRALAVIDTPHGSARWWLLGEHGTLWWSDDAGDHWMPATAAPKRVEVLVTEGGALFAGTADGALHQYAKNGRWQTVPKIAPPMPQRRPQGSFEHQARGPSGHRWVWGPGGACAWTAQASSPWKICKMPTGGGAVVSFTANANAAVWLAATEDGRIYRTTDQGRHWQETRGNWGTGKAFAAIAWDRERQRFIAAGAGGRLLASTDQGQSWTQLYGAPPSYVNELRRLANGDLLATLNDRWMARTSDTDKGWLLHQFDQLDEPAYLTHVAQDPGSDAVLVSGSQGALIYSADGRQWQSHRTGAERGYLATLLLPQERTLLLFGTPGHGMRVGLADGHITDMPLPSTGVLYGGFQDPARQVAFLLGERGSVLQSSRQGNGWTPSRVGSRTLHVGTPTPDGNALLVAGDGGALYRAEWGADGALGPWQAVEGEAGQWRHMVVDPAHRAVWLVGLHGEMRQSFDQGRTWLKRALPTTSHMRQPVFDARRNVWWMPGRDGTLLRGNADGSKWQAVFTHTAEHLKGIWVHPDTGDLYAWGDRLVKLSETPRP